jgi:hypothetical protein
MSENDKDVLRKLVHLKSVEFDNVRKVSSDFTPYVMNLHQYPVFLYGMTIDFEGGGNSLVIFNQELYSILQLIL